MHITLRRLAVGGVLGLLILVGASVTRSGAEKKVAHSEVTSRQDLVGREVNVQFRRDAAGTATMSPGIKSGVHNGAVLSLVGKLISASNDGLILEYSDVVGDTTLITARVWIPIDMVLYVSHQMSRTDLSRPELAPPDGTN